MIRFVLLPLLLIPFLPVSAQGQDWGSEKCAAYSAAWNQALDFFGSDDVNYAFLAGNENFIAGGCVDHAEICPGSAQEFEIANAVTIAVMNAGAASTFLPFRCAPSESASDSFVDPSL